MAIKNQYSFKKRQKELAKKKKQEEKRLRRLEKRNTEDPGTEDDRGTDPPE